MDMNFTLLVIALSPTTITVAFIIFGLRSVRTDLKVGLARLDSRMDRFENRMDRFEKKLNGFDEKIDADREGNRRSFEKLFGMVGELSERVARIEGYMSAPSFFTGAESPSTVHQPS